MRTELTQDDVELFARYREARRAAISRMGGIATAQSGHGTMEAARQAYRARFTDEEYRDHMREIGALGGKAQRTRPRREYDPILALMKAVFGRQTRIRWSVPASALVRAHRARGWP